MTMTANHAVPRDLAAFRRVVVKIGSSLLVDSAAGTVRRAWLGSLADDLADLWRAGADVMIVSSGAIAMGRAILGLPRGGLKLEESQAAAAVGQIALARAYAEILGERGMTAGQVLLTLGDTEERRRYLNARSTLGTLLKIRAVPMINENDTVATSEIRYGDNDRLAARVGAMMGADCLVLLSDVDGLYTAPPGVDVNASFVPFVTRITPEIEAMAGSSGSELSRGGMATKVAAARMAVAGGAHMAIASGRIYHPLRTLGDGGRATWFLPAASPATARKGWIAGALEPRGALHVDAGAVRALARGRSLLPAGVARVEGAFARGDAVAVIAPDGREIGRGLVAYDDDHARAIAGRHSRDIEAILGYRGRDEMVHRDDLALFAELHSGGGSLTEETAP